jgi:uncharacterized protein (TIGR02588 family)
VVILLAMVATILNEARHSNDPARPVATVLAHERAGDRYAVRVRVHNQGDLAAANVQVIATLEIDGDTSEGEQTVDFLAAHDAEELVFVFDDDPDDGDLEVEAASFSVP